MNSTTHDPINGMFSDNFPVILRDAQTHDFSVYLMTTTVRGLLAALLCSHVPYHACPVTLACPSRGAPRGVVL